MSYSSKIFVPVCLIAATLFVNGCETTRGVIQDCRNGITSACDTVRGLCEEKKRELTPEIPNVPGVPNLVPQVPTINIPSSIPLNGNLEASGSSVQFDPKLQSQAIVSTYGRGTVSGATKSDCLDAVKACAELGVTPPAGIDPCAKYPDARTPMTFDSKSKW